MKRLIAVLIALSCAAPAWAVPIAYKPQPVSSVGATYSGNLMRGILSEMDRALRKMSPMLDASMGSVGMGGAPTNASYLVLAHDATLTSERVLSVTAPITLADGGANAAATIGLTRSAYTANSETNITLTLNGSPTTALVDTCRIVPGWQGDLAFSRLTQIGARSVLGVTGNSTADVAGIQGTTNQVLRVDSLGTGLSFGTTRVAGGGTGITAGTSGGIPYFASTSAMASSALLAANGVVYGGGAAASPTSTAAGTTSQVLIGGTPPSFGSVPAAALDTDLQEIAAVSNVRGDLLVTDSGPTWVRLPIATANQFMRTDGTDPAWSTSRALTTNNATNITLTANGSPTTALLDSVRLVPGWTGLLSVARGGTGTDLSTLTVGDIIYANGSGTFGKLADVAVGSYLRSGGSATAPLWSTLTLPNAITSGAVLYGSAANVASSSGALTANGVVYGGGAGGAPASTAAGTTSQVLIGGTPPSFGNVPFAAIPTKAFTSNNETNITLTLNGTPSDALVDTVRIVPGWSGTLSLARGGSAANLTAVNGGIVYSGAAAMAISAAGTTGQLLRSAGAASPTWTTATFPATAGTSGNVLTSDGTNWSSSTPAVTGVANPTGTIGLSAVNGSATTAIRSDGAPALSQAIAPSWTADHIWVDARPIIKGSAAGPLALQWWNTASGANGTLDLQASPGATGAVTVSIPNAPGQVTITGSGSTPPTSTEKLGKVNITGKTDTIAVTNLTNITGSSIATGFYMVSGYLACTTAEAAAGTLTLHLTWTDDSGTQNAVSQMTRIMTTVGSNQFQKVMYISSGNIAYGVRGYTNPAGGGTPAYAVRVRVTFLGT